MSRYGAHRTTAAMLLIASLLFSFRSPAYAAGGVSGIMRGTVVDSATNAPIAGATVSATSGSGNFKTTTDARGFFSMLNVPPDTYTVRVSANNYIETTLTGVTIYGDQTQPLGTIKLVKGLKTIATVQSHGATAAFQPHQAVDVTTFQGQRVDQALGYSGSTNFNQLVESAPGVIRNTDYKPGPGNSSNAFTIRGSASVEIGYQFDGVDYRGSFFDENPSQGYLNGVGGGKGGLQVVSGAGDATQGGVGAGVVNVIPGIGSSPGTGFLNFGLGSPWYEHSVAGQYGWGSPDGHFSDFFSFRSDRAAPPIAPYGRDASDAGQYLGTSFTYDDDVLNNFYYRFGKNNNQIFQVLTDWLDHRSWANYGGLANVNFYPYDPFSYANFQTDYNGIPLWPQTPSGRIELQSETLGKRYGAMLPSYRALVSRYPLTLITPASDKRITSTFGGLATCDSTPVLEMHPDDAAHRGLTDGQSVKVWNDAGEVVLPLRITANIRAGVICSEKGAWLRTSRNGQTVSALAPTHKADIADGACFNDARGEVQAH